MTGNGNRSIQNRGFGMGCFRDVTTLGGHLMYDTAEEELRYFMGHMPIF